MLLHVRAVVFVSIPISLQLFKADYLLRLITACMASDTVAGQCCGKYLDVLLATWAECGDIFVNSDQLTGQEGEWHMLMTWMMLSFFFCHGHKTSFVNTDIFKKRSMLSVTLKAQDTSCSWTLALSDRAACCLGHWRHRALHARKHWHLHTEQCAVCDTEGTGHFMFINIDIVRQRSMLSVTLKSQGASCS